MTGAMYSAVSGLKTHMQNLNVIGHNIANVNTQGFKAGRSVFASALYTGVRTGSNGTETVGGRNPSQLGYGVSLASVDVDMSTSTYIPTGKDSDCMIDGDGFFLLGSTKDLTFNEPNDFKQLTLTRVGDLEFKADGFLSNHAGDVVYGFQCLGFGADGKTPVISTELTPIFKPRTTPDGAVMYTAEQYRSYYTAITEQIEDRTDLSDEVKAALIQQYPNPDAEGSSATLAFESLPVAELDSISIDESTGKVSGTIKDTDKFITIGFIAIGNVTNPNGVTQETGTYYKCGDGAGDLTISMLGGSAEEVIDVSKCQDFEYTYEDGVISGGQWQLQDDITVESQAPTHVGGRTNMSGMQIHTGGTTKLITAGLEQTNVDLATEISNMILTQRGYQANTRIVTVTDSMLEELINMKR